MLKQKELMSPDLDEALVRDFPLLFRDRHASPLQSCMHWGFECGDGWEPLIRRAAEKLEKCITEIAGLTLAPPYASQVKEKYGTLRFYLNCETDEMAEIVHQAEMESEKTCEECGSPGKLRGEGWYYTACYRHTRRSDK